ncbi:WD40/YVTN/BNR-like repeat-containing protein [Burkholderia sp. BCC1998]|uniref:WD40/YVTN/BNR-like repeat-containing protein n=1 Tax=Burkholderia sp. BCC1998 TaxID=2817447 RepID=UPI002AB7C748|nr:YCF48-related protein [Burkholderia sp. BCC1998]
MKWIVRRKLCISALIAAAALPLACQAGTRSDIKPQLQLHAAEKTSAATQAQLLGAAHAGKRLVVVGDHGVVLLSDDDGKRYRQASSVPVDSTLTSVFFPDERNGWAVGHWGVIIRTRDGGETWTLQRNDITVDQPLFSVYFANAREGWAVGLWSLMLHTIDGGATWNTVTLPPTPGSKKADRNLYAIFADGKGVLHVACEQGRVMRSTDGGENWTYAETGYVGSFWTGVALEDGTLLVGGIRGAIYRSTDGGVNWAASKTPFRSSVTDIVQLPDKRVVAASLDGIMLASADGGFSFTGKQRADRVALTTVIGSPSGTPLYFSTSGVEKP